MVYNYAKLDEEPIKIDRAKFIPKGSYIEAANSCFTQDDPASFQFWLSLAVGSKDLPTFKATEPDVAERASSKTTVGFN